MAATLTEVRDALASTLADGVPGLHAEPRMLQVHPPQAVIELDHVEYHTVSNPTIPVWFFNLTVLVSMVDVEAAQVQLDAFLSPDGAASVRKALEDDPTLGGVVDDTTVMGADGYQEYQVEDMSFLGARFQVEVRP